jgi:hypothetical protein
MNLYDLAGRGAGNHEGKKNDGEKDDPQHDGIQSSCLGSGHQVETSVYKTVIAPEAKQKVLTTG